MSKGALPIGRRPFFASVNAGFTLVELVTTLLLLGILSFVAMPRFFDRASYAERGFQEDLLSSVRYAQKLARFSGCETRVETSAAGYALTQRAACTSGNFDVAVQRISGGAITDNVPNGLALGAADFYYDSLGRPLDTGTGTSVAPGLTVGDRTLTVEAETGFAHW
ncbi:MAG: prepilin-type N-terminal cleavage/methylation domain-containing protein [Gammaproteobacteria bacterium]|nr:prepilin-type N-terminal cleavage/methylation domain-containing protein [Gammaproteobacteria bacterium]MBU1656085.1 prepilin-type N-terminal cleavage/methylation domain-containing protein [Gammaproteobacteria bacterium]MBU1962170.1 prepilin-type N-terminal cleavage/methylation domain-containing protein [Gammaproteobacteria bacterium]